jgi:hypothetical protein
LLSYNCDGKGDDLFLNIRLYINVCLYVVVVVSFVDKFEISYFIVTLTSCKCNEGLRWGGRETYIYIHREREERERESEREREETLDENNFVSKQCGA